MSHYQHLSIEERESIWAYSLKGVSKREIARRLGRDVSTISRELKRNRVEGEYRPSVAQKRYEQRRTGCRRPYILAQKELCNAVVQHLTEEQWSPEQIANRLALERGESIISYPTIYRAIHAGRLEPKGKRKKNRHGRYKTHQHLRRKGWKGKGKPKKQATFVHQTIDKRPKEAHHRTQIGHWEGDLVYSSAHKVYIITLVDRCSRYLLTGISHSKKPEEVANVMLSMLESLPADKLRSITLDRGKEFANHSNITKRLPHAQFFFAHPHSPWERGTNENTNGLLRQYIPKHSYKTPFSPHLLALFTHKLNHRPRKCLAWRNPSEIFFD